MWLAVLAPAFLIFCHNLLCFIAAALTSDQGMSRADSFALMVLIEIPLIAFVVLLLWYRSTLVQVDELPHPRPVNPRQQFGLELFLSLTTLLALATMWVYSLHDNQSTWIHGLHLFLQLIVWLFTAVQLLQPRIRWWLVLAMTLAMFGVWFGWLMYRHWDLDLLRENWGRMQAMLLLTVLAYRWAGWRIVSASIVDDLRDTASP